MAIQTIICGDVLEEKSRLLAKGVGADMIFADPNFNVGLNYAGGVNDRMSPNDYYDWCEDWIELGFRLLKDTGTFYLMTIDRHLERLMPMMADRGRFVNLIKWRNVAKQGSNRRFWNSVQPILMYGKTDSYKFNPDAQRRPRGPKSQSWDGREEKDDQRLTDYWDDIPFVYAGSINHPEALIMPGTNKKLHPCQMPIALAARAILFSTNPGDQVLEPFSGLAATGAACALTGRDYIGIDQSADYCEVGRWRIEECNRLPALLPQQLRTDSGARPLFDLLEKTN